MNQLESDVQRVLRQPEPPPDLADRVVARAFARSRRRRRWLSVVRTAATVAVMAGVAAGAMHYQRRRVERIENERAKAQVIEAFRLAGEQLRPYYQQLEQMRTMTISISEGEE